MNKKENIDWDICNHTVSVFIKAKTGASAPEYKTSGSAGADLRAYIDKPLVLKPMQRALIPTGLSVEIPQGFELQVRPRSGLALKNGVTVLNTPGTVDSDYRGELCVLLVNFGDEDFKVKNGDRIAQAVICPVVQADFIEKAELSQTERGTGGYGSTGIA